MYEKKKREKKIAMEVNISTWKRKKNLTAKILYKINSFFPAEAGSPVGAGKIWTVEGVSSSNGDGDNASIDEEDTKLLLLEKEFEDFYEDQVLVKLFV